MSNHSIDCDHCGVDLRAGERHATWCPKGGGFEVDDQVDGMMVFYDDKVTLTTNRHLRWSVKNLLQKYAEHLRYTAPWSNDRKDFSK